MEALIALAERMNGPFAFSVLAIIGGVTIMVGIRSTLKSVERQKQMDYQQTMDLKKIDGPKQINAPTRRDE